MSCCPTILTPQEQWLMKNNLMIKGRERTLKLNDLIRKQPIQMDINRARLFTESMKETEGANLSLRWAKAFLHITKNIPIYIEPNYELIVGKMTGTVGRFITLYPENDGPALLQLRGCEKRPVSPFMMTEDDLKVVEQEIYPYWKDKSFSQAYAQALPEETRCLIFGDDKNNFSTQQFVLSQSSTARSSLNFNYDVETLLEQGLKGYRAEAEQKLQDAKKDPVTFVKEGAFWEACIICCQACTTFIQRYAKEARRVAETISDIDRKTELLQIADDCAWIAENPARDFRTALQLQWFQQILARLEQNVGGALGNSRMDQHLLPYYQQDIAAGTLTKAQAKELLECYWLNLSQLIRGIVSEATAKLFEAYAHFETVTIGGQTKDGKDATNELSYLILESKQGFPTPYPDLAARVHAGSPDKFLRACAEIIKEGQGFPKLFNDIEKKVVTQTIPVDVPSNNQAEALSWYSPELDYNDEEGFSGRVQLNPDTLTIEAKGSKKYSYQITDSKQFLNLVRNDPSSIPRTTTKNGRILELVNVDWQVADQAMAGDSLIATRYNATAHYAATAQGSRVTGYTANAVYTGEVSRQGESKISCSVVYQGTLTTHGFMKRLVVPLLIVALVLAIVLPIILRKRKLQKIKEGANRPTRELSVEENTTDQEAQQAEMMPVKTSKFRAWREKRKARRPIFVEVADEEGEPGKAKIYLPKEEGEDEQHENT